MDLFGKGLVAFATVGTGAVSLATVENLSPRGLGSGFATVLAIAGLLAAADIAHRRCRSPDEGQPSRRARHRRQRRSRVDGFDDVKGKAERTRIYQSTASRYGFTTLLGLSDRERDLRRAATRAASDEEQQRRVGMADEIRRDPPSAGAVALGDNPSSCHGAAASAKDAVYLYVGVAAGLLCFAIFSDAATANQDDNIAIAKSCGDARKAGAMEGDLHNTKCYVPPDKDDDEEDGDEAGDETGDAKAVRKNVALAQVADQLVGVVDACYGLARTEEETDSTRPLVASDCDSLSSQLTWAVQKSHQASTRRS